jgi:small subunit ribosomal protein S20
LPQTKSAQKEMRAAKKRRLGNKTTRTLCKSRITKAETLIFSGEVEKGKGATVAAISSLDKAAAKGIIHPNNAARRKSRLIKKLNQAQAQPSAEEQVEKAP